MLIIYIVLNESRAKIECVTDNESVAKDYYNKMANREDLYSLSTFVNGQLKEYLV